MTSTASGQWLSKNPGTARPPERPLITCVWNRLQRSNRDDGGPHLSSSMSSEFAQKSIHTCEGAAAQSPRTLPISGEGRQSPPGCNDLKDRMTLQCPGLPFTEPPSLEIQGHTLKSWTSIAIDVCLEKRRPLTAVSYQYLVYYLAYYLEYDDIPSRDRHRGRLDTVNNHRLHYCICDVIGARRHTRQGTSLVLTCFTERGVPFWTG